MVDVGSLYRITYTVTDATGALVNASTIAVALFLPDGTAVGSPPSFGAPDSTGKYHTDYLTTVAGRHTGVVTTTNPVTTRGFTFNVTATPTTGLISLAAAKTHLNLDPAITTDDDELLDFILAATDIVESKVGAVVVRPVAAERHDAGGSLWLRNLPVVALTSITPWLTFGVGYPVNLVRCDSESGRVERLDGYPFVGGPFAVAYTAGRPVVAASILHGAKQIIEHMWETQRGGMTFAGAGPGPGEDDVMFAIRGKEYTVPRRVLEMLAPEGLPPRSG